METCRELRMAALQAQTRRHFLRTLGGGLGTIFVGTSLAQYAMPGKESARSESSALDFTRDPSSPLSELPPQFAATVAVCSVVATGTVNSWHMLGGTANFMDTYVRVLAFKIALVMVMIGLAALNRYSEREQMEKDSDLAGLRGEPQWREILDQMRP